MARNKKNQHCPASPLEHVVNALSEYFSKRGGHGIQGEVVAIFEPHIENDEVKRYCIETFGDALFDMVDRVHQFKKRKQENSHAA